MPDRDDRPRFDKLNWLGRAAVLGGAAVRLTARALDEGVKRAATTLADAEKAFQEGRDPNVEDAKVIEERDRGDRGRQGTNDGRPSS
jgi:hypothetical protein